MKNSLSVIILITLLSACANLNDNPANIGEAAYKDINKTSEVPLDNYQINKNWWQEYNLQSLNNLVNYSLNNNPAPFIALYKYKNAMIRANQEDAGRFPTFSGNMNAGASKPLSNNGNFNKNTGAGINASWEIDLWGRLENQRRASDLEVSASHADLIAAKSLLAANVVKQYWQLIALENRIKVANEGLQIAIKTRDIVSAQYRAGAISGLDNEQANQALNNQKINITSLNQQRNQMRNALLILLDKPAGSDFDFSIFDKFNFSESTGFNLDFEKILNSPVEIISNRPDIFAAQKRLEASFLQKQISKKAFYPSLSLSGALSSGASGDNWLKFLSNPAASLGAGLSLPFFNYAQLVRNEKISENDYMAAELSFRQSVLTALNEINNSLFSIKTQRGIIKEQGAILNNATKIEKMTYIRYKTGAQPLRDWLSSQDALNQAKLSLIEARLNELLAQVDFYQAISAR